MLSSKIGTIIMLDVPSSSGKSTLSQALQTVLDAPFWRVSIDMFWFMLPPARDEKNWCPNIGEHQISAYYNTVVMLAKLGINVIAEGGFTASRSLLDFINLAHGVETVFAAVKCSLSEIERREARRDDRFVGYSRQQYHLFHTHVYDIDRSYAVEE